MRKHSPWVIVSYWHCMSWRQMPQYARANSVYMRSCLVSTLTALESFQEVRQPREAIFNFGKWSLCSQICENLNIPLIRHQTRSFFEPSDYRTAVTDGWPADGKQIRSCGRLNYFRLSFPLLSWTFTITFVYKKVVCGQRSMARGAPKPAFSIRP